MTAMKLFKLCLAASAIAVGSAWATLSTDDFPTSDARGIIVYRTKLVPKDSDDPRKIARNERRLKKEWIEFFSARVSELNNAVIRRGIADGLVRSPKADAPDKLTYRFGLKVAPENVQLWKRDVRRAARTPKKVRLKSGVIEIRRKMRFQISPAS